MTKDDITQDRGEFAEAALVRLMRAAGRLHRLVVNKDDYGKDYYLFEDDKLVPYDRALTDAARDTDAALEHAGGIYVLRHRDRVAKA